MSGDLESRLERQLSARAEQMPIKHDRLDSVTARGRRRQMVSTAAVSVLGLAGLAMIAGLASFAATGGGGSQAPADGVVTGEPADDQTSDDDTSGEQEVTTVDELDDGGTVVSVDGSTPDAPSANPTDDESETRPDAGTDTESADGTGDGSGTGAETDAGSGTSSDSETGTESEPDSEPDPDGDAETGTGPDDETGAETDPEVGTTPTAGRATIGDFDYLGAFRLSSATFGASDTNYAVGTLAFNPARNSLFVAGHGLHGAVAEFDIPSRLGTGRTLGGLPVVDRPRQPFASVLDRAANPDGIDRITGLYVHDGALLINAENRFDATGDARDTTLVVADAADLDGSLDGYYRMDGGAEAAGYMSPVPAEWRAAIGGPALTGWASNYGIVSRYSIGPSLYGFSPDSVVGGTGRSIDTTVHMSFPHSGGRYLASGATGEAIGSASPMWNVLSRGVYGFIVPGTRTFAVVGSNSGVASGIGEQFTQDNGEVCPGFCPFDADDQYNQYWLFDLDEILSANSPATPRPYAFGRWNVPFDDGGEHEIIGATLDPATSTLYLSLSEAGQVGEFDRPPLIVAYRVG